MCPSRPALGHKTASNEGILCAATWIRAGGTQDAGERRATPAHQVGDLDGKGGRVSNEQGRPAALLLDGWAGRERHKVEVIGETPKRYRVRLLADTRLPSNRQHKAGDVVLVPKYAVVFDDTEAGAAG